MTVSLDEVTGRIVSRVSVDDESVLITYACGAKVQIEGYGNVETFAANEIDFDAIKRAYTAMGTLFRERVMDRKCWLKRGRFKRRLARITGAFIDSEGRPYALAQPYRLDGRRGIGSNPDLLWDSLDARTYWELDDIVLAPPYTPITEHWDGKFQGVPL